jgi:hypothetical protein
MAKHKDKCFTCEGCGRVDTILEIYDEMQKAIETGMAYQTRLNPPEVKYGRTQRRCLAMA